MTTYEVRVSRTKLDYYRFEAKDAEHAKQMALTFGKIGKVDSIMRKPIADYALKVVDGEITYE
tara:strand:+ start:683 stop:871 length:189 start_codon:yes stop_codon:yes gene_type:complete